MSLLNRIKLFKNFVNNKTIVSHDPSEVGIEITNFCNLNCIMCSRRVMQRKQGHISWQLFKKIVDQTCNTAEIYSLYGLGEPLLHPNLFQMIDYCHQKHKPVTISTNAMLLDNKMTEKFIYHPPDHLLFAIDAHTKKTYKQIRKGGDFDLVKKNINYFLQQKRQKKLPTYTTLLFVKQDLNEKEEKAFIKFWQNKGADNIHIKPKTEKLKLKANSNNPTYCLSPWKQFFVTWQGTVYPCCLDVNNSFKLGNLKNHTVAEIWNGSQWQGLRASFKSKKLKPLCRSCTLRQPSLLGSAFLSFLPELTIKKFIPYIDRFKKYFSPLFKLILR